MEVKRKYGRRCWIFFGFGEGPPPCDLSRDPVCVLGCEQPSRSRILQDSKPCPGRWTSSTRRGHTGWPSTRKRGGRRWRRRRWRRLLQLQLRAAWPTNSRTAQRRAMWRFDIEFCLGGVVLRSLGRYHVRKFPCDMQLFGVCWPIMNVLGLVGAINYLMKRR